VIFDQLGFDPSFDVEIDPEFPGDGDWGMPLYGFAKDGQVVEDFRSVWGSPIVIAVTVSGGANWVGMFTAAGLSRFEGVFACPGALDLCVVAGGDAFVVDVSDPASGARRVQNTVWQVARVTDAELMLLVRPWNIVAVGPNGVAWSTPRLAVDDLHVESADSGSIVCSCDNLGGSPKIELDPTTGEQVAGTRLDSFWPPDALA
jgi:hypothetical protein